MFKASVSVPCFLIAFVMRFSCTIHFNQSSPNGKEYGLPAAKTNRFKKASEVRSRQRKPDKLQKLISHSLCLGGLFFVSMEPRITIGYLYRIGWQIWILLSCSTCKLHGSEQDWIKAKSKHKEIYILYIVELALYDTFRIILLYEYHHCRIYIIKSCNMSTNE